MSNDPIRIFVGTPANNEDLECMSVLSYSLHKHTSVPIEITWMMLSRDPNSFWYSNPDTREGWNTQSWATPFSALRWGIPAACNFEGRAIYMDCDQIALADIKELYDQPIPDDKAFLAKRDGDHVVSCVMLFDNARMKKVLPPIDDLKTRPGHYRTIRQSVSNAMAPYRDDWNCRDGENCKSVYDPHVKVLHYTFIPTQPNHKYARHRLKNEGKPHWFAGPDQPHPRADVTKLFDETFAEACLAGCGPETFRVNPEFGNYGR